MKDLVAVTPGNICAYLSEVGFKKDKAWGEFAEVWRSPKFGPLIIPKSQSSEDYAEAVEDVVLKLSRWQQKPSLAVWQELKNWGQNLLLVRLSSPQTESGSLSLDAAPEFWGGLKPLIRAAAWSVINQRPMHLGQPPKEVTALVKQSQVGLTQLGSYVVPIFVPKNIQLFHEVLPDYGGQAFRTLKEAVDSLSKCARSHISSEDIGSLPFKGVTTNFCDAALQILTALNESLRVDFKFEEDGQSSTSTLQSEDQVAIRHIRESLTRQVREDRFLGRGYIIGLQREEVGPGKVVFLTNSVSESPKKMRIDLAQSDYEKAVQAHKSGKQVEVRGTLRSDGRRYTIEHASVSEIERPVAQEFLAQQDLELE